MPGANRIADPISCGDHIAQGSPNVFVNNLPFARTTDATTGHGCYPPTVLVAHAQTVFCNNLGVALLGITDIQPHCCGPSCHSGNSSAASTDVFVE